jgi:AcrR family transcriptional regulator
MSTTLNDVASHAGVHVQTLYKHFKTKEELAIASAEIVVQDCRKRFEEQFPSHSAFAIWRQWIEDTVSYLTDLGIGTYKQEQVRSASSLLNDNYLLVVYSGYEDLLAEYLAQDFKMDPKINRLPRLVACMLWSGNEAAMKRSAGLDTAKNIPDFNETLLAESLGVIDDVEKIFSSYIKLPRP